MSDHAAPEDRALYAELRALWTAIDPMPDGLVDEVMLRLAPDLDTDVELLALQEGVEVGAALRSAAEPTTFTFARDDLEVLLRITPQRRQHRRIDGWAAPRASGRARLRAGERRTDAEIDANGRFEFEDVTAGTVVLDLRLTTPQGLRTLRTPPFEI